MFTVKKVAWPLIIIFILLMMGAFLGRKNIIPINQMAENYERIETFCDEIEELCHKTLRHETWYQRWKYGRFFGDLQSADEIPVLANKTYPARLIGIRDAGDVTEIRKRLLSYIWKRPELPRERVPDEIVANVQDNLYADISALERITSYRVKMEYGIESIAYHFFPKIPNGKFVIYHQGHGGNFVLGKLEIEKFLARGWSVIAFAMPFLGMNPAPDFDLPKYGYIKNFGHDTFYLLERDDLAPIKFFLEPVAAVVNFIQKEYQVDCFAMTGLSGGGWTTVLYSALDERICYSIPVSANLPIYLQALPPNHDKKSGKIRKVIGDYDEFVPALNQIANFLELSVLGSAGPNRKQIQIFNKYDRLAYRGIVARHYENAVSNAVREIGKGAFSVVIDDTHTDHKISDLALAVVFANISHM